MGWDSRALSIICLAAAAILADVFGLVVGLAGPGFNGSGGGARSGSELSHLRLRDVSRCILHGVKWLRLRLSKLYRHRRALTWARLTCRCRRRNAAISGRGREKLPGLSSALW